LIPLTYGQVLKKEKETTFGKGKKYKEKEAGFD